MHSFFGRGPKGSKHRDEELAKALNRAMRRTDILDSNIVGGIADIVGGFVDKVSDIGGHIVGEITGANAEKAAQIEFDKQAIGYELKKTAEENYAKFIATYSDAFDGSNANANQTDTAPNGHPLGTPASNHPADIAGPSGEKDSAPDSGSDDHDSDTPTTYGGGYNDGSDSEQNNDNDGSDSGSSGGGNGDNDSDTATTYWRWLQ